MRKWAEDEILILQHFNRTMRIEEIGRLIGRTEKAIRVKAKSLNISLKKRSKLKTHTGIVISKDGERRVKLHETAITWCVGPKETYYKFSGRRVGAPSAKHRLLLSTIKLIRPINPVKPVKPIKSVKPVKSVKPATREGRSNDSRKRNR